MSSTEPLTLAVAANDVAQFVKFHETGKKCVSLMPWPSRSLACQRWAKHTFDGSPDLFALSRTCRAIEDLGAKARVMQLMTHADPDVKYQRLLATQRLMSHAWA